GSPGQPRSFPEWSGCVARVAPPPTSGCRSDCSSCGDLCQYDPRLALLVAPVERVHSDRVWGDRSHHVGCGQPVHLISVRIAPPTALKGARRDPGATSHTTRQELPRRLAFSAQKNPPSPGGSIRNDGSGEGLRQGLGSGGNNQRGWRGATRRGEFEPR